MASLLPSLSSDSLSSSYERKSAIFIDCSMFFANRLDFDFMDCLSLYGEAYDYRLSRIFPPGLP